MFHTIAHSPVHPQTKQTHSLLLLETTPLFSSERRQTTPNETCRTFSPHLRAMRQRVDAIKTYYRVVFVDTLLQKIWLPLVEWMHVINHHIVRPLSTFVCWGQIHDALSYGQLAHAHAHWREQHSVRLCVSAASSCVCGATSGDSTSVASTLRRLTCCRFPSRRGWLCSSRTLKEMNVDRQAEQLETDLRA